MIRPVSVRGTSTARSKFSEFKIGYHEGTLADVTPAIAARPVETAADAGE